MGGDGADGAGAAMAGRRRRAGAPVEVSAGPGERKAAMCVAAFRALSRAERCVGAPGRQSSAGALATGAAATGAAAIGAAAIAAGAADAADAADALPATTNSALRVSG